MTKSERKKASWAATRALTQRAMELAKTERIPLIEALARVVKEEHGLDR